MVYAVKELFRTLQGEGANTGRVAVFCRFTGCNLWSGREQDRAKAVCRFCDTDFVGGDTFGDPPALASAIEECWGDARRRRFVVFTGGEPLLQLDKSLVDAVRERAFYIAVETNGTIAAPEHINWICVSPKAATEVVQRTGNELKLVFPQTGLSPEQVAHWDFDRFYLQPKYDRLLAQNTAAAIQYCLQHPQWALSIQTHKIIGLP
jgi:7-carboxy-7-deazaguanine synthase